MLLKAHKLKPLFQRLCSKLFITQVLLTVLLRERIHFAVVRVELCSCRNYPLTPYGKSLKIPWLEGRVLVPNFWKGNNLKANWNFQSHEDERQNLVETIKPVLLWVVWIYFS